MLVSWRVGFVCSPNINPEAPPRWWFQIFFSFSPLFWEDSHFDSYFSKGLVQPPTSHWFSDDKLDEDLGIPFSWNGKEALESWKLLRKMTELVSDLKGVGAYRDEIPPSYIGIIIGPHKDPY